MITMIMAEPTATPMPTVLPSISPVGTPVPLLSYAADPNEPLPENGSCLPLGGSHKLGGVVESSDPLTSVSAFVMCDFNEDPYYPYIRTVTFDPSSKVTRYDLNSTDTLEGVSLNSLMKFGELHTGRHRMQLFAANTTRPTEFPVANVWFDVLDTKWQRIKPDDFNGTYKNVSAFFGGDTKRFLYQYQHVFERYLIADQNWENAYITEFMMDEGDPWLIHMDALPFYEQVRNKLYSTFVRVHGTNGDTGVVPLLRCIESYSGSYVSRFTSSKKYISHHAFGTASDINATLSCNENTKANISLIDTEVRDLLDYHGVVIENGVTYYDFIYSGSYPTTTSNFPESILNYLLYELAFYPAGFQWGHYYNSSSDAMHFTLADNLAGRHDGQRGLRKVFSYIEG